MNLDIKYMFLVGGFAESGLLQQHLKDRFSSKVRTIIPQDVGLTILKGAVCFGIDPCIVAVRVSRLTYGVGVLNKWISSKHPENKRVRRDGVDWCIDVFDKFVACGQSVALGDSVLRSYTPASRGQAECLLNLYCSEDADVEFTTNEGVRHCGTLRLFLEGENELEKPREIQARMIFGDTEIKANVIDLTSGRCVRANIDFLNK